MTIHKIVSALGGLLFLGFCGKSALAGPDDQCRVIFNPKPKLTLVQGGKSDSPPEPKRSVPGFTEITPPKLKFNHMQDLSRSSASPFITTSVFGRALSYEPENTISAIDVSPGGLKAVYVVQRWKAPDELLIRDSLYREREPSRVITSSVANLINPKTGHVIAELKGHKSSIISVEFSRDSRYIVTGGADSTARIWDAENGYLLKTLRVPKRPRPDRFGSYDAAIRDAKFNLSGDRILAFEDNGQVHLFNAHTGFAIAKLDVLGVGDADFSLDGQTIITSIRGGKITDLWSAANGNHILRFGTTEKTAPASRGIMTPDQQSFVISSKRSSEAPAEIRIFDFASQSIRARFTPHKHQDGVRGFAISPDSRFLLTTSTEPIVRIWDIQNGELIRELVGHQGPVLGGEFSADGQRVITWSMDSTARVWDVATGNRVATIAAHAATVYVAKFLDPQGFSAMTASYDHSARIWKQAGTQLERP